MKSTSKSKTLNKIESDYCFIQKSGNASVEMVAFKEINPSFAMGVHIDVQT
jgi:hypothetical protein